MDNTTDISNEAVERMARALQCRPGDCKDCCDCDTAALLRALRAALDEAQRDTQRLDVLEGAKVQVAFIDDGAPLVWASAQKSVWSVSLREAIDAATPQPVEGSSQQ